MTLDVPRVSLADAVRAMIRVAADNPGDVLDRLAATGTSNTGRPHRSLADRPRSGDFKESEMT